MFLVVGEHCEDIHHLLLFTFDNVQLKSLVGMARPHVVLSAVDHDVLDSDSGAAI